MRLRQLEERVHLRPGMEIGITPAGDVPASGRIGQNWVVVVFLPGNASIGRVGQTLAFCSGEVRLGPGGGETRHGCVEGQKSAIDSAGEIDRLAGPREDTQVIVQSWVVVLAGQVGGAN